MATISETNLNVEEIDYIKLLYKNGVGVALIGRVLTSLLKMGCKRVVSCTNCAEYDS